MSIPRRIVEERERHSYTFIKSDSDWVVSESPTGYSIELDARFDEIFLRPDSGVGFVKLVMSRTCSSSHRVRGLSHSIQTSTKGNHGPYYLCRSRLYHKNKKKIFQSWETLPRSSPLCLSRRFSANGRTDLEIQIRRWVHTNLFDGRLCIDLITLAFT